MLVLTRKAADTIRARVSPEAIAALAAKGEALEFSIVVVDLLGTRAKLGLDAPRDVQFARGELSPKGTQTDATDNGSETDDPSA